MRSFTIDYKKVLGHKSLICLLSGAILVAGIYFRVAGFDTHVTYIDELICLTEGQWVSEGEELSYSYQSPWDFAKKVALHDGVTYAPLQFMLTYYFIKPYQTLLSPEALAASRIPSVIIGCLSLVFLFLLFYLLSNGKLSYSFLLPLTLLAVSRINIVNSQQNHTYIMGVLVFMVVTLTLLWLYDSKKTLGWAGAAALLCVLPFANYQVVPIVIFGIGLVICGLFIAGKGKEGVYLRTLLLMPALVISVLFAGWIMKHKASNGIPWWIVDFGFALSPGEGFFGRLLALIKNIYFVLESLLLSSDSWAINLLSIAAVISIVTGGLGILIYKRPRLPINVVPLLVCLATLGLFLCLYFTGTIALSPSRHTLILTPAVLVVVFYCSLLLENSGALRKTALTAYKRILAALSVLLLANAVMEYPEFYRRKTEAFQPQKIIELSEKENLSLIMLDPYTYNKAYMFLRKEIEESRIRLKPVENEEQFPDESFLLIGQNVEGFHTLYNAKNYKYHISRLLYVNNPGYDFEPSSRIDYYWPNKMHIYRVDKGITAPGLRLANQPQCSRGYTDAPAESTYFFLQNAWQKNQYLNVEKDLKSSPIGNDGWVSAHWWLGKVSDSPVTHYTIRNGWTGEYLYIDTDDGNTLKMGKPSGPLSLAYYWAFEPVDGTRDEYRIRSMSIPELYINTENQLDEGNPPQYNVQVSRQESGWVSARWRLCDSTP